MQIGRQVNTNDITRYVCKIARQSEYRNLYRSNMVGLCAQFYLPAAPNQKKPFTNLQLQNVFDFNRIKIHI